MALVAEKLVAYFVPRHQRVELVVAAGEEVNRRFPDAKGFVDPMAPDCLASFKSGGSAYWIRFDNCRIYYDKKNSTAPNPKFWFDPWTKALDFSTPMKPIYIVFSAVKKDKENAGKVDWKKDAEKRKKLKLDSDDELLKATQNASKPVKITSLDDIKKLDKPKVKKEPKKAKKATKKAKPKVGKEMF